MVSVRADGYFPFGEKVCIVWATMDVLMCTASIWHMATISVDRYCSMRFPLRYRRTRTPLFVVAKIAFVWIVSVGICSPLAIAGFVNPRNVYRAGECAPAVPQFVIYGSVFAFFVPLVLMVVSYALTVRTLKARSAFRRRSRQYSVADANLPGQPDGTDRTDSVRSVTDTSSSTEKNRSLKRLSDGECATEPRPHASSTTALDRMNLDESTGKGGVNECRANNADAGKALYGAPSMAELMPTPQDGAADIHANGDCIRSATSNPAVLTGPVKQRNNRKDENDVDHDDNDKRRRQDTSNCDCTERNSITLRPTDITARYDEKVSSFSASEQRQIHFRGQETLRRLDSGPRQAARYDNRQHSISTQTRRAKRKATRVLGVIFLVFVVLWTPFFVLNLLSAVCPRCVQAVEPEVWTVLVWLGWISSLANPIIYTSFSPAFRSAFKRLLTCHCRHRRSMAQSRQQQWTNLLRRNRTVSDSSD